MPLPLQTPKSSAMECSSSALEKMTAATLEPLFSADEAPSITTVPYLPLAFMAARVRSTFWPLWMSSAVVCAVPKPVNFMWNSAALIPSIVKMRRMLLMGTPSETSSIA